MFSMKLIVDQFAKLYQAPRRAAVVQHDSWQIAPMGVVGPTHPRRIDGPGASASNGFGRDRRQSM